MSIVVRFFEMIGIVVFMLALSAAIGALIGILLRDKDRRL